MAESFLARWWRGLDRPGWRSFAIAMAALTVALLLALYSGAAAETGRLWLAGSAALAALAMAGWVALSIVPVLARHTPLRWFAYQVDYRLTREGAIYLGAIFVVAIAALNTGNNLLFMVLGSLLAGFIVSGVLSRVVLNGIELKLELPEHIFAGQPILALAELRNEKQTLASFSLCVVGDEKKRHGRQTNAQILSQPVYFPYIPRHSSARQNVELVFSRRGVYRQEALGIRTKFPFGFLEKTRRVDTETEVVVYPRVEPTEEFYEVLPLVSGELESFSRGRGHDLYSIRDYQTTDSARHVDWKASAKTGALKVREFTREDERRVMLVLDTCVSASSNDEFERAVTLCACLAWHFYEIDSVMEFRTATLSTSLAPAGQIIYDVLHHLALLQPEAQPQNHELLQELLKESYIFKIIITSQPRGSIPTSLWTSSYLLFMQSLWPTRPAN